MRRMIDSATIPEDTAPAVIAPQARADGVSARDAN
jgi:hypothetical protein